MEPSGFGCMKHGVLAASVSCLQSADSPMHNSGVFGHIFDVSLSGRSYTYTFSSSEVSLSSLSFPSSPLMSDVTVFFLLPHSPLSFILNHFYFFNFNFHSSVRRWTKTWLPPTTTTCGRIGPLPTGAVSRCVCG